jgi:hypothetical protein
MVASNKPGNFIMYADGKPVLIDLGIETYTAKTFSSRRYEIWTMQSGFHNLPTINGVEQKDGRPYAARGVSFSANPKACAYSHLSEREGLRRDAFQAGMRSAANPTTRSRIATTTNTDQSSGRTV